MRFRVSVCALVGYPLMLPGQAIRLTPGAAEIARITGLDPLIQRLDVLRPRTTPGQAMSLETLSLRQLITEQVLATSLDVDAVIGEIQDEQAQIQEMHECLQVRRDRRTGLSNLASAIVGAGIGVREMPLAWPPAPLRLC